MKFTFDRNSMINEISIAQEIITSKSSLSSMSNVLLIAENNSLTIKATDTKVNFQTKIPVDIETEGSVSMKCDKFMIILGALPEGEIEFNLQQKDNAITAVIKHSQKKIKFQLKCMPTERFPEFDRADDVGFFDVPAKDLRSMILQTSFAVSTDESRLFMNGVYFENTESHLALVATDGRRLAYCSKNILENEDSFSSALVHPKVLNIIAKHSSDEGNISIAIIDKMIFFRFANYELSSILLDGPFPNYKRVIPENQPNKFGLDRAEFLSAIRRISIMIDKKVGRIYLNITPGVLKIYSQETDIGDAKEEIPCEYAGEDVTIAMNCRPLEDPLKVMTSERITFEFSEPLKPVTLKPEPAEDFFHIIMPMQLE